MIDIPQFLTQEIKDYVDKLYELPDDERIIDVLEDMHHQYAKNSIVLQGLLHGYKNAAMYAKVIQVFENDKEKKAWNQVLMWLEKKELSYSETEVFIRKQIEECL